jgi:hypothetical protein
MIRLLLLLLLPFTSFSQVFTDFIHWQNDTPLSLAAQTITTNERTIVGGTFRDQLTILDAAIFSVGGNDIVLAQLAADGMMEWIRTGGSERNDQLVAIESFNEWTYATGTYWIDAQFDAVRLQTSGNTQGIFLLRYDEVGTIDIGLSIDGSGDKEVNDLAIDSEGNLLLTGSFNGSIWIDEDTLQSEQTTPFLLKLNASGNLIWAQQGQTHSGKATGIALTILPNNDIVVFGEWIGETLLVNDTLRTDTEDEDVFLVTYSTEGEPLWVRDAGGVFPSFAIDVVSSDEQIFVIGNFVGRMEFSESRTIESLGVNEDIFLLSYNFEGDPLWAKRIGATTMENVRSLAIRDERLLFGGFFRETLEADEVVLSGAAMQATAFIVQTNLEGEAEWGNAINASENAFINQVQAVSSNEWQAVGDFTGTITAFGDIDYTASTFNPFIARFVDESSSTFSPIVPLNFQVVQINDLLTVQADFPIAQLQLFSSSGQLLRQVFRSTTLAVGDLNSGVYVLSVCGRNGYCGSRVIWVE